MKLSSKWIKHARTPEQKKEVMAQILAAKPALDLLRKILEAEMLSKKKVSRTKEAYEMASWPYMQADMIGEERAYLSVLKLLSFNLEEN